jgi:hypothetical protein
VFVHGIVRIPRDNVIFDLKKVTQAKVVRVHSSDRFFFPGVKNYT